MYFPQALLQSPTERTYTTIDYGMMLTPQGWDVENEFGWKVPKLRCVFD